MPGPSAFIAWAKTSKMGDRDMGAASDEQLLALGNNACDVLSTAKSFGDAVQSLAPVLAAVGATNAEVEAQMRASVDNLCPQYKGLLP